MNKIFSLFDPMKIINLARTIISNNRLKKRLGIDSKLANLLGKKGYKHLLKIIKKSTDDNVATIELAKFLISVGIPDHAITAFEEHMNLNNNSSYIHYYLQSLMFTSPNKYDNKYLYDAHTKWSQILRSFPQYKKYSNELTKDRRLKIGYTCHFFTNSTSSTLLLPILKNHNKEKVEIFVYSDQEPSQISDEVRSMVENWHDTINWDDNEFCEQIKKDSIDILLELNGHCNINRFRALTRKPAPIQINYYNYTCTSGVPGIDYYLAGEEMKIDYLQPYFSEKIFYKKGITIATPISQHFPPVSSLPMLKNGYVTFGSFGQSHKVSREQIQLWCDVLKRVPESKFYMKASVLDCPISKSVFQNHFASTGIDMTRVIFEGSSDYATLLNCYSQVDIALDTYPCGAGTTTFEAVMQGVPVITLVGERACSWHGYNNLHNIGHDELICKSKEEYIKKASDLATDKERLKKYRNTLRDDVINSPRGDLKKFITELEDAYKEMWSIYINQQLQKKSCSLAV